MINELNFVRDCYSWWDESRHKLHLFVCVRTDVTEQCKSREGVMSRLKKLPDIYKPDKIHFIENIELTENGKISTKFLKSMCVRDDGIASCDHRDPVDKSFESVWNDHLNVNTDGFIKLGGTSIMALQISTEICELLNVQFPNLIGMLLNDATFDECLGYIKNILSFNERNEINVKNVHESTDNTYVTMDKSFSNDDYKINEEEEDEVCLWQRCKGKTYAHFSFDDRTLTSDNKAIFNVRVKNTFDLLKCVDASPTIFRYK